MANRSLSGNVSDRGPDGRFIAGNRGGPGRRPGSRNHRRMRGLLQSRLDDDTFVQVIDTLTRKAIEGDVTCIKLCLLYGIGRPIAEDEAQHLESLEEQLEQWEARDAELMDWSLLDSDGHDDDSDEDGRPVTADEMLANLPDAP